VHRQPMNLPVNDALAKGDAVKIGFVFTRIDPFGGKCAGAETAVIFHGNEDAEPPRLIVSEVRSRFNCVAVILDRLSHDRTDSLSTDQQRDPRWHGSSVSPHEV